MSTNLSRRGFLAGFTAVALASTVSPALVKAAPRIYQDGVNCDVDGMLALLRGETVLVGDEMVARSIGEARAIVGELKIHIWRTLEFDNIHNLYIDDLIIVDHATTDYTLVLRQTSSDVTINTLHLYNVSGRQKEAAIDARELSGAVVTDNEDNSVLH